MKLSALTSSLPLELPKAIHAIADLGFQWIDVPPTADPAARRALLDRDLRVSCVGLEREQPPDVEFGCQDVAGRERALNYFKQAVDRTAELRAKLGYLTPPTDSDSMVLGRWSDDLLKLAEHAKGHEIRICIEHFPRRALPTVRDTLRFLKELNHSALALLIDVGHCLISGEDAAASVAQSGDRLGYIHFDDNDGVDDLHWALLDGRLTESQLAAVVDAQRQAGYQGALCIELNSSLPEPLENLRRSQQILERYVAGPS